MKTKLPAYAIPTVFVPLYRFPLNPNGKIDRPALPFPEPADLASAAPRRFSQTTASLSATEKEVAKIWADVIRGISADAVYPDSNFWDLGGHSIIAQNMLTAVRRKFDVDVRMKMIFQHPTLRAFCTDIDRARDPTGLRLDAGEEPDQASFKDEDYAADASEIVARLPKSLPSLGELPSEITVLLTGATGFLGAYLLRDLLSRSNVRKVITHVRAQKVDAALERVVSTCTAYGIWDDSWASRIECITGDLSREFLGTSPEVWKRLTNEVDVIIHNGAQVHWIYPYSTLRKPNVLSTKSLLELCASGKPKRLGFVSSTSVLDNDHYVKLSETSLASGGTGVLESDDLEGSRKGLGTGYGQSKWAGEFIVRECGRRGLVGSIIRPGYVLGDTHSGTTNTDDFLVRFLKGCVQVSAAPDIPNTINQTPVTHVARVVVATTLNPPAVPLAVSQVTAHPRLRFSEFGACLADYGYDVTLTSYDQWRKAVERYVETSSAVGKEDHALLPLYDMVTSDLPSNTKAPELDDRNAAKALKADAQSTGEDWSAGAAVTPELVGVYLAYLIAVGFVPAPTKEGKRKIPAVQLTEGQKKGAKIGGRGGGGGS